MTDGIRRPVVAVTRDERAEDRFSRELERIGLEALPLSTIRIVEPRDIRPLEAAVTDVSGFEWVVFTSAHAVEAIGRRAEWLEAFTNAATRPRVAAVGAATAERLAACGVEVHLTPENPGGGAALARALVAAGVKSGARVLWPRSEIARPELADTLRRHGAVVSDVVAYDTVQVVPSALAEYLERLERGQIAATAFLSPSSAGGLAAALGGTLGRLSGRTLIASLGPTTTRALVELGTVVDIEAAERRGPALAAAIGRRLSARQGDAA